MLSLFNLILKNYKVYLYFFAAAPNSNMYHNSTQRSFWTFCDEKELVTLRSNANKSYRVNYAEKSPNVVIGKLICVVISLGSILQIENEYKMLSHFHIVFVADTNIHVLQLLWVKVRVKSFPHILVVFFWLPCFMQLPCTSYHQVWRF